MINKELRELFLQQKRLLSELSEVGGKISNIIRTISEKDLVESKLSVSDDKEFIKWFTKLKKNHDLKIQRKNIKNIIKNGAEIPNGYTAVYGLYQDDLLVYVGITKNIHNRIKSHKRDKKFTSYRLLQLHTDRFYAMKQEHDLIEEMNPIYNKSKFV